MSASPKIRARGLRKRYEGRWVLDGVDLDIEAGGAMVVIGASGSGKSVLLRLLLGLVEPDAGTIEIDGGPPGRPGRIGMLFQNAALFDSLPIWENAAFALLMGGQGRAEARRAAIPLLARVGLGPEVADLYPAALSGGMRKRVGLARAIAARPDILFFDEPTTGLDPLTGALIDGLIVDCVRETGATALSITHDMSSAMRIGREAAMLHEGRIAWRGPAARLLDSGNPLVERFTHGGAAVYTPAVPR